MRYTCITVPRIALCRSHKAGAMGSDFSNNVLLFPKKDVGLGATGLEY